MTAAQAFQMLHRATTGFIMPNAWDAGSARILEAAGFPAIGTTSAGIAFSLGKQDYQTSPELAVPRDVMVERMREIANAVSIPVNGDLEAGYGDTPEEVAETIRLAIGAGLAGGNIEDKIPFEPSLYDATLATERVRAAREAIDASGNKFVLTARSDAISIGGGGLNEAVARSNLYREAGADCLFTPGAADLATIGKLAREINGPLNMVLGLGTIEGNAHEWIAAGVQRVSLGGTLARTTLGFLQRAARELSETGAIRFADIQLSHGELNALFASRPGADAPDQS